MTDSPEETGRPEDRGEGRGRQRGEGRGRQRGEDRAQPDHLHDMGGDIGPASIRGSNAAPGGRTDAEPASGYSEPMGYVAGRDDDWPVTAGSDEKAVASRTDQVEPDTDTMGPSPQATPGMKPGRGSTAGTPAARAGQARQDRPAAAVDPAERGLIDENGEDLAAGEAEAAQAGEGFADQRDDAPEPVPEGGHITADLDWAPSEEDDPDSGSGRTEADDGGYLPGEGTGRPY